MGVYSYPNWKKPRALVFFCNHVINIGGGSMSRFLFTANFCVDGFFDGSLARELVRYVSVIPEKDWRFSTY